LTHGTNTVVAEYIGDSNFVGSTNSLDQVINTLPVASNTNYTRAPKLTLKINIASLLSGATSDADGDARQLTGISSTTGGGTASAVGDWIYYTPPTGDGNDSFDYTVSDGFGGSATATITITKVAQGGYAQSIVANGGTVTIKFFGIPGLSYYLERSTTVNSGYAEIAGPLTADVNDGHFTFTDNPGPSGTFFYRSIQH